MFLKKLENCFQRCVIRKDSNQPPQLQQIASLGILFGALGGMTVSIPEYFLQSLQCQFT